MLVHVPVRAGIAYVGPRAFDGLSVAAVADAVLVLAGEGAGATAEPLDPLRPPRVLALEDCGAPRRRWVTGDIAEILDRFGSELGDAGVLPYAGSDAIDALRSVRQVFAARSAPTRRFDDKVHGVRLFDRLGLPAPPRLAGPLNRRSLEKARRRFGCPFVARSAFGSTGTSVLRLDAADALSWPQGDGRWLFEPFVEGYSANVTGVVFAEEVVLYPASVQIVGEPSCTDFPFGYSGNDFPAAEALPPGVVPEARRQARLIGAALGAGGFRGAFGVDFLVGADGTVMPCEINPRFQNSTGLLNFAFADGAPELSPARLHADSFAAPAAPAGAHDAIAKLHCPFSQLVVRVASREPARLALGAPPPGVYRHGAGMTGDPEQATADPRLIAPATFLAAGTVPRPGTVVEPGAAIARLVFRERILRTGPGRLTATATAAIDALRDATPCTAATGAAA